LRLCGAPGYTITAIAALTLGISAGHAVFSVVNSVLLKPLPYPEPDRIVAAFNASPHGTAAPRTLRTDIHGSS
jgi:putative ABC transport system permease protein